MHAGGAALGVAGGEVALKRPAAVGAQKRLFRGSGGAASPGASPWGSNIGVGVEIRGRFTLGELRWAWRAAELPGSGRRRRAPQNGCFEGLAGLPRRARARGGQILAWVLKSGCLLYTSDAADEEDS